MSTVWLTLFSICVIYSLYLLFLKNNLSFLGRLLIFLWIFALGQMWANYKIEKAGMLKFNRGKQEWEIGEHLNGKIKTRVMIEANCLISTYKKVVKEEKIREEAFKKYFKEYEENKNDT